MTNVLEGVVVNLGKLPIPGPEAGFSPVEQPWGLKLIGPLTHSDGEGVAEADDIDALDGEAELWRGLDFGFHSFDLECGKTSQRLLQLGHDALGIQPLRAGKVGRQHEAHGIPIMLLQGLDEGFLRGEDLPLR